MSEQQRWADQDLTDNSEMVHGYGFMMTLYAARQMRDGYEDELARLRAELAAANERIAELEAAQNYEPVSDCINIGMARTLQVDGQNVCLWDYIEAIEFTLPDDVCIMLKRRPQPQEVEP